jgi:hypothetical protein
MKPLHCIVLCLYFALTNLGCYARIEPDHPHHEHVERREVIVEDHDHHHDH